jgi:hypothetical protein
VHVTSQSQPHAIESVGKHSCEPVNNGLTQQLKRAASAVPPHTIQ